MNKSRIAVAIALLVLVAGGIAVAVALGGAGLLSGQDAFQESHLDSFETTGPVCADPRVHNSSTYSRPARGGTRLSLNETIPVATRNATLDSSFDEVGPRRYHLDVERIEGGGTADCALRMRFNATLNLTEANGYTLILTYDGQLKEIQWSEPNAAGASSSVEGPEPRYAGNRSSDGNASAGGSARAG